MGNYRFRLSDMMPNAWFYKLKDMGKSRNTTNSSSQSLHQTKKKQLSNTYQQPQFTDHRHSYYFNSETVKPADKLYNSPINPKSSDVHFASDPPRKSSKRKSSKRRGRRSIKAASSSSSSSTKLVSSSVSAGCSCRATLDSVWTKTDNDTTEGSTPDYSPSPPDTSPESRFHVLDVSDQDIPSWSSSCSCRVSSSATDIIMDVDTSKKSSNLDGFHALQLPPILTKPAKFNDMVSEIKKRPVAVEKPVNRETSSVMLERKTTVTSRYLSVKEESIKTTVKEEKISRPIRRISANSPGLKLRSNSPRISCKKIQAGRKSVSSTTTNTKTRRKNISESFAIVKSSFDPQRDFRESMVEMIVENNIRASKDLEELLACYLSLNSNEYHDIIVKVFEQIWFDLTDIQL